MAETGAASASNSDGRQRRTRDMSERIGVAEPEF
jgi:hypothetical protein